MQVTAYDEGFSTATPSSRFLALPRELRDMIYDHALTSQSGLESRIDGAVDKVIGFYDLTIGYEAPEFNQLQNVSKQVRAETRGVSMKNNTLFVTGTANDYVSKNMVQGMELAVRFLEECSPQVKAKIRDLRIWNYVFDSPRHLTLSAGVPRNCPAVLSLWIYDNSILSRFCQQYPRAQVSLRGPDYTEEWLMSFGVMYHYHTTFENQRRPSMPYRPLDHDSYENYGDLRDEEISALRLPMVALPRTPQIEIEDFINPNYFDKWSRVLPRKSVVDVLDTTRKFFDADV